MALVTLAEYKAWTNTTSTADDATIELLLQAVSDDVEAYCNRKFALQRVWQWTSPGCRGTESPTQWPVIRTIAQLDRLDDAVVATNGSADESYSISIRDGVLTVATGSTMATEDYTLSAYANLQALFDEIAEETSGSSTTGFIDLSFVVSSSACKNPASLMPGAYELPAGGTISIVGASSSAHALRLLDGDLVINDPPALLAYDAGYATIPANLQRTISMITRDALKVANGTASGGLKSMSITNYSETYADGFDYRSIVNSYSVELSQWRRVTL